MVFRHLVGGRPDVIAGEIDVLPAERRQVSEEMVGHVLSTSAARTIFEQMLLIDLPRPARRHAAGPGLDDRRRSKRVCNR